MALYELSACMITDSNHTDTASFPTKHTYTYIKNVKNIYFVKKADR